MTAQELIALLRKLSPDATVRAWDADAEDYVEVTGAVFDDQHTFIDLQTDSDEEEDPKASGACGASGDSPAEARYTTTTPARGPEEAGSSPHELFTIESQDARGRWGIEEHFRDRLLAEDQLDWLRRNYPDKEFRFRRYVPQPGV